MAADKVHPATLVNNIKQAIPIVLDLEANNYINWATLFELHTHATLTHEHISTPPNVTSDADQAQWKRIDAIVRQWIYSTVSPGILTSIISKNDTAKDAWNKLENLFHDNKSTRAVHLEDAFSTTYLKDFPTVDAYCDRLKTLADQLANVGVQVSNERLVLRMIRGLSEAYAGFVTIIQHHDPLPPFAKARSMLSLEERNRKKLAENESGSHSALHVTSENTTSSATSFPQDNSNGGSGGRGGRGRRNNYNNRNRGGNNNYRNRNGGGRGSGQPHQHQSRPNSAQFSPHWVAQPWTTWSSWPTPPCPYPTTPWQPIQPQAAKQKGILGPHPQAQAHYASPAPNVGYPPTDIDSAMHTLALSQPDDTWYMDTGATSHMTANSGVADGDTPNEM